jgi:DNA-binding response OmpR family regulator
MRILLVEDDTGVGSATSRALASQGWAVDWLRVGEPVAGLAKEAKHDVLVLDIGLSDIDGFEVLRRLRERGGDVPVLILTARDAIEDRVRGLRSGADDYLVKPFAMAELVARIGALARRRQGRSDEQIRLGALRLDRAARRALVNDAPLALTLREWSVLVYLVSQVGRVVSKEQIVAAISGWDEAPSENAIEVYVSRLRAKLGGSGVAIRSIRGFGYLVEEARAASEL